MKDQKAGQILWGIDILGSDLGAQKGMIEFLTLWADELPLGIQPVYVMRAKSDIPAAGLAAINDQLSNTCSSEFMRAAAFPKFSPVKILIANGVSLRARMEKLLDHACATRAAAIALTTHARSGPPRWILGSFTEALVLQSRLPLLILNPRPRTAQRLARILFPTDFSEEASRTLQIVIREAKLRKLGLTILHSAHFDFEHPEASFGPAAGRSESKADYLRKRRALLHEAVQTARTNGLAADEVLLEDEHDLVKAILDVANEWKADLIAMTSYCGPFAAALGGSLTRKIIREADCPVWAIPPESLEHVGLSGEAKP